MFDGIYDNSKKLYKEFLTFYRKICKKMFFFKLPQHTHTPYPFKRKNTANQQEVQYKKVYNTALKEKRAVSKR